MAETTSKVIELVYLVCIAHVWARGTIFRWARTHGPRLWVMLADCPLCSGFWIGAVGYFLLGNTFYCDVRGVIEYLGIGSFVGTLALATCALIRRL